MIHKIILILNKDGQRVCEQYCYKDGSHFKHHEFVKSIEGFGAYGLKVTTSKKEWFIY